MHMISPSLATAVCAGQRRVSVARHLKALLAGGWDRQQASLAQQWILAQMEKETVQTLVHTTKNILSLALIPRTNVM